ncbi:L-threonylcarbamoyladenylate synthase [Saccharicrinis sp. FJH2]|uniref:L-threonylcarbamoyladenylate synthase n=1 Tax=Saccharicrinis sp. FJH65 TaxID=3344659 RepID=UPI0035F425B4
MADFKDDIEKALECLNNGGILIYPTDTIWGIGCDATNADAVKRIYALKKREDSKSMLVLLDSQFKLQTYVSEVPEIAYDLIEMSEKPLTIIYDGAKNLAQNLVAEDGSIGIRITGEAFSKQLIQKFKKPIVSTSANISGNPSPKIFAEIDPAVLESSDYVVKFRQDETTGAQPSGIIKLKSNGEIKVIRE